jgi:nucleoside recognition membrane protein YjiH
VAAKLVGCSLFGVAIFLVPIPYDGSWTIVLGVLMQVSRDLIGENMSLLTTPIFVLGALLTALYNLTPAGFARRLPGARIFLTNHWIWTALALLGGIVAAMTFLQFGPGWVIGKSTGVTAFVDVAGTVFLVIGFGCLLLPFLTDYGLLDFVGVVLQRPFQKAFGLPGRATVDTLASWVGASSIAVLMTGQQYEKGFYTARESAVIATNFSVVSIPFVFFVAQVSGITAYFFQLYGAMIVVCLICARATPLLPPLRNIPDDYVASTGKRIQEDVPDSHGRLSWAWDRALAACEQAPNPPASLRRGLESIFKVFLTMMPISMTIEFLALTTYEYTSILHWLTWPLIGVLELLQIPEASAAAPGVLVGLFDMFVPAVIAGTLTEPLTQFVLAGLSVTQLIFFAESAILISRSAIPLSVPQLVQIFAIRTAIALPLLAVIAHWLF